MVAVPSGLSVKVAQAGRPVALRAGKVRSGSLAGSEGRRGGEAGRAGWGPGQRGGDRVGWVSGRGEVSGGVRGPARREGRVKGRMMDEMGGREMMMMGGERNDIDEESGGEVVIGDFSGGVCDYEDGLEVGDDDDEGRDGCSVC